MHCLSGHYVCDDCHGDNAFETISELILSSKGADPLSIAEKIIGQAPISMLGCEHAWIAAGSLLISIRDSGKIKITDEQIIEALNRTRRQAIGAYCGLTGVCGIAPAIGASFSVILGAACPKDAETAVTMKVVSRIIETIANETGPCCCKNFVYSALKTSCSLTKEYLGVELLCTHEVICKDVQRHPHGCRREKCRYYPIHSGESEITI